MTFLKSAGCFVFFLFLTEVASWTIDLPEVRKHLFEKEYKKIKNEYKDYVHSDDGFYSNVQGNSMHNSDEHEHHHDKKGPTKSQDLYDHDNYAEEFGYQSYMEKKVQEIVHDGSVYLEGLRRSLEEYSRFLEECNRRNTSNSSNSSTTWDPPVTPNSSNMTFNSTDTRFQNFTTSGIPNMNITQSSSNRTMTRPRIRMTCREAMESSEKVRRFADLAMWATKRLQDLAYAGKYQKTDKYEENELILKLAWFLDQLAVHKEYLPEVTTMASTSAPMAPTLVPQTEELKNFLINCMKTNSSIPATIRCRYPLPLPDAVAQVVGGTSTASPQQESGDVLSLASAESSPQEYTELLITSEDSVTPKRVTKRSPTPDEYYVPIPVHEKPKPVVEFIVKKLTNLKHIVKNVKKHAVADFASQIALHKQLHKRSIDDDTSVLINRLTDESKPDVKPVELNVKSLESNVKYLEPIVKNLESNVKSLEPSDKTVDSSNDSVPPIHLPVIEASVINTKSFKKRSIEDNHDDSNDLSNIDSNSNTVKKREIDSPLTKLAKYYVKYKVWETSNQMMKNDKIQSNFDVNNDLQISKNIEKRSPFAKKNKHFKIVKPIVNRRNGRSNKHKPKKQGFFSYLRHFFDKKKGQKKYRYKRSLLYEHMYLPREPTNPVGDISYYVKNKIGTNYNPSLTQAAQVRLGLQQAFETGNIEVIHRYGSNYNPANPAPFYAGILKSMADS